LAKVIDEVKALKLAVRYQGNRLSRRDESHFAYAYKIFILVCTDLEYYQPISTKRIIRSMSLLHDIDKLVRFQDHLLEFIRHPWMGIDSKIVEEAGLGFILPTARAFSKRHRIKYFRTLNTVAQFLSKLYFKDTDTASRDLKSFKQFQECAINFDETIADGISELLPAFSLRTTRRWKFGPGASYEVSRHAGSGRKYQILDTEPCNYTTYRLLARLGFKHWTHPEFSTLSSRAIAVPKSISKRRIITVEKTFHTMAAQALRDQLLKYIKDCNFNIFIDDQSFNRVLAQMGSDNGMLVTIDMHAASDSVTIQLVRRLFKHTGLLPYLEDARASMCEIEGEMVALQTYAGMGNAVTFPLECIVFAAVVEYVAKRRQSRYAKLYAIVGDDIVVHKSLFKPVVDALESLGFIINRDKTFGGDFPFRESCGIEALSGYNVTPVRVSRKTYFDVTNQSVDSLIAVSNNLYDYGLKRAASAIRKWFRLKDRGIPYTDNPDEYGMLIWDIPVNDHLKSRYNSDLQRTEIRVRKFTPRATLGSDEHRYRAWLVRHWQSEDKISQDKPDDGLPDIVERVKVGPLIAMPRWTYIPQM
jgi:hypothetical protein